MHGLNVKPIKLEETNRKYRYSALTKNGFPHFVPVDQSFFTTVPGTYSAYDDAGMSQTLGCL